MKRFTIILAFAAMTVCLEGQETASRGLVELTRKAIQEKRQEIVTLAMTLTDTEDKAFWPLYREWRSTNVNLGDRRLALIAQVEKSSSMSDAEIKTLVDSALKLEDDTLKQKKEYVKKFRKILPEKKVARFFHLESKLDAVVNFDLAGRVALAE
jgi:hypothetical protein